jgi:hypothetical protein
MTIDSSYPTAWAKSVADANPGAVSGQQNSVTAHDAYLARKAEVDEAYWKNQIEGNKRMKATVDAMPLGTPPNNYAEGNKRALEAMRALNAKTSGPQLAHPQDAMHADNALNKQVDGGHYKDLKIQPIEYIHANNIPFAEGCAIKYLTRWRAKGGVKDLEKAKHFIELLIELESR